MIYLIDDDLELTFDSFEQLVKYLRKLPERDEFLIKSKILTLDEFNVLKELGCRVIEVECKGCEENQPNQEAHIGPYGCLGEW